MSVKRSWDALAHEGLLRILGLAFVVTIAGGVAVYLIEQGGEEPLITNLGEALWYSLVTVATIGYGDYTPKTPLGRIVGALLILFGVSVFSVVSASLASILVAQRIREGRGLEPIKFRGHTLVCGWNSYADRVLEGIALAEGPRRSQVVLVNELSEEAAAEVLAKVDQLDIRWVRGDPAAEPVLARANAAEAQTAIVLADTTHGSGLASDERTTLVILAIKSVKRDIKVCAEVLDLASGTHLKRAGADDLVISGEFNGFLLANSAVSPGVPEVARALLALGESELRREPIPPDLVGKTFAEVFAGLRQRTGFLTLAIVTEAKGLALEDLLTDDYSLVDTFIKEQFHEAGMEHLRFEEGARRVAVNPPDTYIVGPSDAAIGIGRTRWQTLVS